MFFSYQCGSLSSFALSVDPVERVGERRQERVGREFEAEHDRLRVGRLDLVDHRRNCSAAG